MVSMAAGSAVVDFGVEGLAACAAVVSLARRVFVAEALLRCVAPALAAPVSLQCPEGRALPPSAVQDSVTASIAGIFGASFRSQSVLAGRTTMTTIMTATTTAIPMIRDATIYSAFERVTVGVGNVFMSVAEA